MATNIRSSSMTIPIFSGGNYDFWRFKRRIFICCQEHFWDIFNSQSSSKNKKVLKET